MSRQHQRAPRQVGIAWCGLNERPKALIIFLYHVNILVNNLTTHRVNRKRLYNTAQYTLNTFSVGEVISIAIVGIKEITRLNRIYRKINEPTDVLSFAFNDTDVLGEVVMCYAVACKKALKDHISTARMLDHLVIHGILHILGFDHIRGRDARIMKSHENMILHQLSAK